MYKTNTVKRASVGDLINAGVSGFVLLGLAYWKVLEYVPTDGVWTRYALAGGFILWLVVDLYLAVRRK